MIMLKVTIHSENKNSLLHISSMSTSQCTGGMVWGDIVLMKGFINML